jgi:hypothetical protein
MREKARIRRICNLLYKGWIERPDQRLGQFLANYVFGHHVDIFGQEDDKNELALESFLNKVVGGTLKEWEDEKDRERLTVVLDIIEDEMKNEKSKILLAKDPN